MLQMYHELASLEENLQKGKRSVSLQPLRKYARLLEKSKDREIKRAGKKLRKAVDMLKRGVMSDDEVVQCQRYLDETAQFLEQRLNGKGE